MPVAENEKMKRRFFRIQREAEGNCESTIAAIERAIHLFEESTEYKPFKTFCERQATRFKTWLQERTHNGNPLAVSTRYHVLRHVKSFFTWLSTQHGFKSRISLDAVSYLTLDKKSKTEALSIRPRKFPSLEQVKAIINSIKIKSEIDKRDRALICFLLLTGIRYTAACSLRIDCLDTEQMIVSQDPSKGVRTKGGKLITTHILKFDNKMFQLIVNWAEFLKTKKKFGPYDPLFPQTKVARDQNTNAFTVLGVEPKFWSGGGSIRKILKDRCTDAGTPYFEPHSFRHAHVNLALKTCRTPEELKALSQNIGHEQVTTTLRSYGTLDDDRVEQIISGLDFSQKETKDINNLSVSEFLRMAKKHGIDA